MSDRYALRLDAERPVEYLLGNAAAAAAAMGTAPEFDLAFSVDGVDVVTMRAYRVILQYPGPQALDEMLRKANAYDGILRDMETASLMVENDASDAPGRISTAIRPFLQAAVERAHRAEGT